MKKLMGEQYSDKMSSLTSWVQKLKNIRKPLFWQLSVTVSSLILAALISLWIILQSNLTQLLNQQAAAFGEAMTKQTAESISELVMAGDRFSLNVILSNIIDQNEQVSRITVLDDQNNVLATVNANQGSNSVSSNQETMETFSANIPFRDVIAGTVVLSISNHMIADAFKTTLTILSVVMVFAFLLLIPIVAYIARRMTTPIEELKEASEQIAKGSLDVKLPNRPNDEMGDLVNAFENMVAGLKEKEKIKTQFNSYMSEDIADTILSDLNDKNSQVSKTFGSILFIDVVSFTSFCENESAEQVASMLNDYYRLINQSAKLYRGTVNKFIGDGALISFGINKEDKKHAMNAICCGQIFIKLLDELNQARIAEGKVAIRCRLGLHSGPVLAGSIGAKERLEYAVLGDTVNTAARLCDAGQPDVLIISQDVLAQEDVKGSVNLSLKRTLDLKGKDQPINCYDVEYLSARFNQLLIQQHEEMVALRQYG